MPQEKYIPITEIIDLAKRPKTVYRREPKQHPEEFECCVVYLNTNRKIVRPGTKGINFRALVWVRKSALKVANSPLFIYSI